MFTKIKFEIEVLSYAVSYLHFSQRCNCISTIHKVLCMEINDPFFVAAWNVLLEFS